MNQKCFLRRIIRSCSKTSSLLSDLKLSVKSRLNYKSWDSQDGVFCHHFCHHCQPLVNGERTFASSQFSKHFPNLTFNVCFILSVKQSADHLFYLKCCGKSDLFTRCNKQPQANILWKYWVTNIFTNMIQVGTLEKMFYISLKLVFQNDWLVVERKCLKTLDKQQQ